MIRAAIAEDAEAIAELENCCFPDNAVNENTLRRELTASDGWVVLAEEGLLLAYALVRHGEPSDLLRIGVRPDYQGKGLGRMLLDFIIAELDSSIMLTVARSNRHARHLYESVGFETIGHLPQAEALLMLRPVASTETTHRSSYTS